MPSTGLPTEFVGLRAKIHSGPPPRRQIYMICACMLDHDHYTVWGPQMTRGPGQNAPAAPPIGCPGLQYRLDNKNLMQSFFRIISSPFSVKQIEWGEASSVHGRELREKVAVDH